MPYITKKQLNELKEIARIATMQTASFGFDEQEKFFAPLETFGQHVETSPTAFIKERTKIWRKSWIVDPLQEIIADIEGRDK